MLWVKLKVVGVDFWEFGKFDWWNFQGSGSAGGGNDGSGFFGKILLTRDLVTVFVDKQLWDEPEDFEGCRMVQVSADSLRDRVKRYAEDIQKLFRKRKLLLFGRARTTDGSQYSAGCRAALSGEIRRATWRLSSKVSSLSVRFRCGGAERWPGVCEPASLYGPR